MNEKIFVTGASGFAGKSLVKYLEEKKFKVSRTGFKNLKNLRQKKNIKIDLTKKISLKKHFDWIIHTASYHKIEDFINEPNIKAKKNILMVKNLINFAKSNTVKKFIYFSTIDINYFPYPIKKKIYIRSKIHCEKILEKSLRKKILEKLVILRLPAMIGKGSNNNFIKNMLLNLKKNRPINIWNKNKKYNNFVHIDDLCKLIYYLLKKKYKKKIIMDCLSSNPIKLKSLVHLLKKRINSKSKINYIDSKLKFKKIRFNTKTKYQFFDVRKASLLLT